MDDCGMPEPRLRSGFSSCAISKSTRLLRTLRFGLTLRSGATVLHVVAEIA